MSLPTASKTPSPGRQALRDAGATARWVARGARAWITFKPGSRPRRAARNLALTSIRFVLARGFLVDGVRRLVDRFPTLTRRQPKFLADLIASAARSLALNGVFSERERFVQMRLKTALKKERTDAHRY